MKFCTQCKKDYPRYVDKCTKCGSSLIEVSYEDLEEEGIESEMEGKEIKNSQKSLKLSLKMPSGVHLSEQFTFLSKGSNMTALFMKRAAIIMACVSLGASSISAWMESRVAKYDEMGTNILSYSPNWGKFFYYFLNNLTVAILLCCFLFALGEVIELLQKIYDSQQKQNK